MSELNIRPGLSLGNYPQKSKSQLTDWELHVERFFAQFKHIITHKIYNQRYVAKHVAQYQQNLLDIPESELTEAINQIRDKLYRQGLSRQLILQTFAIIRETASRVLGKSHYDVQLYGGWLMINGMLTEMETGEGKTLTTTLAACTAALAGIPVHVITANDYLAARDCETMQPLYARLGLSSNAVIDGMETVQRQQAYLTDIVHTTNKQVAFDYLRDRIEMRDDDGPLKSQFRHIQRHRSGIKNPLLLRGLCFALVDEADSVLIDEAVTPLIITKPIPNEESADSYGDALYLASALFVDQDFTVDQKSRSIDLTNDGEDKLSELIANLPSKWQSRRMREHLVTQALTANHFFTKDKHYLILDGKIQIIDQSTGRVMADRSWEQGLHQMIEAKEGCTISELREPQARISYQRFFSRYLKLGGASGTISEVSTELRQVYGLDVIKVRPHRRNQRQMKTEAIYRNKQIKNQKLLERLKSMSDLRRAILIGTCSVEESEQISNLLQQHNISHRVLNAKQDAQEAEIISQAGQPGAITVATNMAGRGTDIALHKSVAKAGGLHVITLSRNQSRRIDRQLYGRCARQGDPGSAEAILSLEDPALNQFYSSAMIKVLVALSSPNRHIPRFISRLVLWLPQLSNEWHQRATRKELTRQDKRLHRILALSGRFE
ncbi:MAG: prepilin peptidase [Gammaproteobacteria bacterium]|nr:prepilin peptidase [Gammaproteobacteria bacterium]